jgi:hypothetical protein
VLKVTGNTFTAVNLYRSAGTNTATVRVCVGTMCGTDDVTIVTGVSSTALQPFLECVADRGVTASPRFTARFGYSNTANIPVYQPTLSYLLSNVTNGASTQPSVLVALSRLSDNKFTTAPAYRSQIQVFMPGRQVNQFQVPFASGNQVWSLNGRTVTASSSSPRCSVT